jgi:signal transduction histidine kinase
VTQERNRLAREIHDSIAHYLTIVNVQLEAAEKLGNDQFEIALNYVQRARRLTVECLQEVRSSVASLRAPTMERLSLPGALEKLAAGFTENTGIPVNFSSVCPTQPRWPRRWPYPCTDRSRRADQRGETRPGYRGRSGPMLL